MLINFIKKEFLFFTFFILFSIFSVIFLDKLPQFPNYIDYPTIRALIGLMLITLAIKESNFFEYVALKILKDTNNEKKIAVYMVLLSVFLSMFLTNDITLFIVVPITLALGNYIKGDLSKLIIFEAIAVNVGSLLTPIGNPQNLFLYRKWDVGFFNFIIDMLPLFLIMFVLLIIFTFLVFPDKKLSINLIEKTIKVDKLLLFSSITLFVLFVISMEMHFVRYFLIIVIVFYLLFKRQIFQKFDYILILTFVLMFIDFHIIANLKPVRDFIYKLDIDNFLTVFNLSVVFSQIMSNVPAAIFMGKFSNNYLAISYGVNLGGNGFLIGSLANVIALRFVKNSSIYLEFHKYSIPFFIVSYLLTVLLFNGLF